LQEQSFERVGGSQTISVDVRLVAATNRDLTKEVDEGKFREDLFYRLNVVRLHMPPLRERLEDLPALVAHFLQKYSLQMGRTAPEVSPEAMRRIYDHPWPGNIRELENALERAVILAGPEIHPTHLPLEMGPGKVQAAAAIPEGMSITQAVEDLEQRMIKRALAESDGVAAHAAEKLGIAKSNLAYKIKKYGIN
jgi:two-component system NtrC family response regulator